MDERIKVAGSVIMLYRQSDNKILRLELELEGSPHPHPAGDEIPVVDRNRDNVDDARNDFLENELKNGSDCRPRPQTSIFSRTKYLSTPSWILIVLVTTGLLSSLCPRGLAQHDNNVLRGNSIREQADESHSGEDLAERVHNSLLSRHPHLVNLVGSTVNLTFLSDLDRNCPNFCADQSQYKHICMTKGCKQWKTGLAEGCGAVCNESEANFREFYSCQVGCSKAIEEYYFKITGMLGVPDPPTLISDSLKSTSLRLSWEGSALPLPYLVFTIQRRFYHRNHQWETLPSQQPLNQTFFTVQGLKPYTEYQFRVGWVLAHDFPPYYSLESNPIATLPKGIPNSPEITSIQPISNTSVSVTWLPPSQPNGKLVAYILKLQILPRGHVVIKEIPVVHNPRGYTFSGLQPQTNYSLSISAQNLEGEGDSTNVNFVTPQSSVSNDISKRTEPRLLLQGIKDIYIQEVDLLLDPDVSVYASNQNITAMAAHFRYKYVFITTSGGQVIRTQWDRNQTDVILPVVDIHVSFMSVDWLHDKLYLVGKKKGSDIWCIKRCDLTGQRLVTIYNYLGFKPTDFAADPYTGYLYWAMAPIPTKGVATGGLYKMDLPLESSANSLPIQVHSGAGLGPFTIDYVNYRILIVDKINNTVLSVSVDGDVNDIRRNTQSPHFEDVESIATFGGIFYWTTGQNVVIEEYNSAQDSFYHNSFAVPKIHQPCSRLIILHPELQPTPTPMAPPRKPQVIYGQTRARVSWRPPPIIAGLGDGSWRQWQYQIKLSDNTTYRDITGVEFIVENLRPSAFYSIQIRAYSASGNGPYSAPIRGKTLRETPYNITFLWGSQNGLYSSNTLGENVQLLASPSQWKNSTDLEDNENTSKSKLYMWSLTWYESSVFFALSNGSVFFYESEHTRVALNSNLGPKVSRLIGVSYAQSVAFDYIGQKLYWSNPKQQTILRCSFASQNRSYSDISVNCGSVDKVERLQVVTMAKEITIDSYKGLLLWSTGHSIEMSRLNGYSHTVLHQTGLFSGIQIMGITLDTDLSRIYWITRSSTGSSLQRLSYNIRGAQLPMVIANYDDITITGPIRYFNDRLIWLQGSSEAVITDLYGQGKSSLTISTISNITNIHVKDQSSLRYPGKDRHKVQVTPDSVFKWSVGIQGKWNNFTIFWQPVNNTNYGKLFYEVVVNNTISKITPSPNITVENSTMFKPYTEIEISITAVTYWVSSKATIAKLKTPSWKPTEPLNPRVFLQQAPNCFSRGKDDPSSANRSITAELRWDAPQSSNGLILGYLIHCWKGTLKTSDCMCEVDLTKLSCEIHNLEPHTQYRFAVQAYTESGSGKLTGKVLADTGHMNPVPKLLLLTVDKLEILDIDRNEIQPIPLGSLNPLSASYLSSEKSIFWFNEEQELLKVKVDSNNYTRTKVLTLSEMEAAHLTIDWLGRKLYWTAENSSDANPDGRYGIFALDLYSLESVGRFGKPKLILSSRTPIKAVTVNPFTSTLFWTTSRRTGVNTLFSSEIDGSGERPFLSRNHMKCNCSSLNSIGDAIAFDPNGIDDIGRGILFTDHQSIWISDEHGCNCIQVVNITTHTSTKLQIAPYRLAADQHHVYWAAKSLFASEKPGLGVTELVSSSNVREVSIFAQSAQPYPDTNCLVPKRLEPRGPLLIDHSSHSLHLQLPKPLIVNCSYPNISQATPKYEVYYGTVDENGISECTPSSASFCKVTKTVTNMLKLSDLHPYTTYTVFVTVTNFYAEREGVEPLLCSPIMLRTAPGAPMPPKLLRLEPINPVSVRVVWGQPEKLNGEKVWYEVNWNITDSHPHTSLSKFNGQKWTETDARSNKNRTEFELDLNGLHPASHYTMWVVAYSEKGDAFSASSTKGVQTFPQPNNLTLVQATPHNLTIQWMPPNDTTILRHQIMYRTGWSSQWNFTELVDFTIPNRVYKITVGNLKPKTLYGFRIKTWYNGDPNHGAFIWPKDGQFDMETLADKPSRPGEPVARGIGKALYEVSWEKSDENGASVEMYSLEYKVNANSQQKLAENENFNINGDNSSHLSSSQHNRKKREWEEGKSLEVAEKLIFNEENVSKNIFDIGHWKVAYNGTETRWQVKDLNLDAYYSFRVRAKNIYGWGEYSAESSIVSLAVLTIVAEPQSAGVIIGMILLTFLILGGFGLLFIYLYRRKQKEKPALQNGISSERREVELATLRELPGGSSFIHQSNILYAAGLQDLILDLDFAGVPKVSRHDISLTKFLGSGAFGDVHEGIAGNLTSDTSLIRVAIKTLRKGATNAEKVEFVQEAKLMTQFRHPHILQLLGICVDTDPCCLLLELMSGGDLLSYLRQNRPNLGSPICLTLVDLLRMCVDVAKGCVYLEEMHFVHRDLAARNCLVRVSNSDSEECTRVVKIGDFGLARDVYRNDYYRKEGEGLLPVRWMAPESLVDGVFTIQTDVWAFGVLLWEIMTLGQQPYPARTNLDVLHYVRSGGRLHQPSHCPESLTHLMLQCWEYNPDNRPSFRDCLSQLQIIVQHYEEIGESFSGEGLPVFEDSPCRYSHNATDPNGSFSQNEDSAFPFESPNGESTQYGAHISPHFPKYLEVLGDSGGETSPTPTPQSYPSSINSTPIKQNQNLRSDTHEGYEIPLPKKPPRNPIQHNHTPSSSTSTSVATDSTEVYGLPPPTYWNTETLPLAQKNQKQEPKNSPPQRHIPLNSNNKVSNNKLDDAHSHYRNLLASSTSEDADFDHELDVELMSDPELFFSPNSSRPSVILSSPNNYEYQKNSSDDLGEEDYDCTPNSPTESSPFNHNRIISNPNSKGNANLCAHNSHPSAAHRNYNHNHINVNSKSVDLPCPPNFRDYNNHHPIHHHSSNNAVRYVNQYLHNRFGAYPPNSPSNSRSCVNQSYATNSAG